MVPGYKEFGTILFISDRGIFFTNGSQFVSPKFGSQNCYYCTMVAGKTYWGYLQSLFLFLPALKKHCIETLVAAINALGTVAFLCYLSAIKCTLVVLFHAGRQFLVLF